MDSGCLTSTGKLTNFNKKWTKWSLSPMCLEMLNHLIKWMLIWDVYICEYMCTNHLLNKHNICKQYRLNCTAYCMQNTVGNSNKEWYLLFKLVIAGEKKAIVIASKHTNLFLNECC